jgi:hypothetical protein
MSNGVEEHKLIGKWKISLGKEIAYGANTVYTHM